ncbi:MAG: phosphoribosylanthranilate isomerase [bacterium]
MSGSLIIKICGITRETDVDLIGYSGADYMGLLIDMPSQRSLDLDTAARFAALSQIPVILLFLGASRELIADAAKMIRPAGVQIQGEETPEYIAALRTLVSCEIWKGVHLPAGSGSDWDAEPYHEKIRAFAEAGADKILLDTVLLKDGAKVMGGTGCSYDWGKARLLAERSPRPVIMAGGLNPENVADAIRATRPAGVDLASGVEAQKGIKDPAKVAAFVKNARAASID